MCNCFKKRQRNNKPNSAASNPVEQTKSQNNPKKQETRLVMIAGKWRLMPA